MPVGLGNNTAEYDTSILPSNTKADPSSGDELKVTAEDQEVEENPPSQDEKAAVKGKKIAVKKEGAAPGKRTRSQVDRIADTEVARFECKKARYETEQERLGMLRSVVSVKAQEKSNRLIRLAELNFEQEKMRLDHEYRIEALKHSQVPHPSSQDSHGHSSTSLRGLQPYSAAWDSSTPLTSSQPFPVSQPFSESGSQPGSTSYTAPGPSAGLKVPSLESFSLPPPEHPHGEHCKTPQSGSDPFDGAAY